MGFSVVGLIVGLGVFVTFMAVILRAAVALANRILPKNELPSETDSLTLATPRTDVASESGAHDAAVDASGQRDLSNPFSPPETESELRLPSAATGVIPTPSLIRSFLTVFVQTIVGIGLSVLMSVGLEYWGNRNGLILSGTALVLNFLILALVLKYFVPTTFPRALLVTVFQIVFTTAAYMAVMAIVFAAVSVS